MGFADEMLDMHSSPSPTFNSALSRHESDFRIPDGLQSKLEREERKFEEIDSNALREIWRRVCADQMTWL